IKAGTYHPTLKANASIIGLRVGSNCDKSLFHLAFNALSKMDRFLKNNGILTDNVQALFTKIYSDNIKLSRMRKKSHTISSDVHNKKTPILFYNWLEDTGTKNLPTKTIDSSFMPGAYYKISKKEADGMRLY
ncbi:cytosolic protein, partial [Bacillus thuringiensis]